MGYNEVKRKTMKDQYTMIKDQSTHTYPVLAGIYPIIESICSANPISKHLSASSRTNTLTWSQSKPRRLL